MRLVWLVHVYLLSIGTLCEEVSKSDVVNIGAIFTFSTINGNVARIAMNAAVEDVNSDPSFLGGKTLTISMHDSNYSGFLGIIGGISFEFYLISR